MKIPAKAILTILMSISALPVFATTDMQLKFQYIPNENGDFLHCTHKRIRDLPDWLVNCGEKQFVAHVIVRHYDRGDKSSIEILYWVTDRDKNSRRPPIFHTTTAWLHMKNNTGISRMSLAQGVENDYASLVMDWQTGK